MNQTTSGQPSSRSSRQSLQDLAFFASPAHACGYLPNRSSVSLFADPEADLDMEIYNTLLEHGFRRSGRHVYRPNCPTCQACLSTRVPVVDFTPSRAQMRTVRRNSQGKTPIEAVVMAPAFRIEQYSLYQKYISVRHPGGGMDNSSPNQYMEFLTSPWTLTEFVEFRQGESLIAVAIMDVMKQGLSSVYTFFDPDYAEISPGRHALLWQISEAQRRQLPYLYLGYWIKTCQKMSYKQEYRPLELYLDNHWQTFDRHTELATTSKPPGHSSAF